MLRAAHPHPAQALSAEAADCLVFSNPPPAAAQSYGGHTGGNRIRHTVASSSTQSFGGQIPNAEINGFCLSIRTLTTAYNTMLIASNKLLMEKAGLLFYFLTIS